MHPSADSPAMSVPPLTDFQDEPADFGRYAGRGKMFSDLAVEYLHFLVSSGHPRATRARAELQHRGIPHQNLAENPSHSPAGAQAIVAPSLDRRWRSITRGGAGVPSYELLVPASRHYVEPHVDADKAMKWTERHFAFASEGHHSRPHLCRRNRYSRARSRRRRTDGPCVHRNRRYSRRLAIQGNSHVLPYSRQHLGSRPQRGRRV